DPGLKTALFRLVDLLPSLHSGGAVVAHLRQLLAQSPGPPRPTLDALLRLGSRVPPLAGWAIRESVRQMAGQFVAGRDAEAIPRILGANARRGVETTFDLLGEAVLGQPEADHFLQRNREALAKLRNVAGGDSRFPRGNLSLKISGLAPS